MNALFPFFNSMNETDRNAKLSGDLAQRPPMRAEVENLRDVGIFQLVRNMPLATSSASPTDVLQPGIFRQADPPEVDRPIVTPITIDMIDGCIGELSGDKCLRDKAVQVKAVHPTKPLQVNAQIAVAGMRRQKPPFAKLKRLPVSFARGEIVQRAGIAHAGYLKPISKTRRFFPFFIHGQRIGRSIPTVNEAGLTRRREAEAKLYRGGA